MSVEKQSTVIRIGAGLLILLIALLLITGIGTSTELQTAPIGYEDRIFKTDRIHSIEIHSGDWEDFLQTCADGGYAPCTVLINGEAFDNVGVRSKGTSSRTAVTEIGNCRYSLKLEFNRYDNTQSYHGLDQLDLNNLLYDNTMMKDFLTYRLMSELEVAAPLCSYTKVYVNGKSLGLYLAVEAMAESFLKRNYGSDHGKLYTPEANSGNIHPNDVKLQYLGDDPSSYPNIFNNAGTDLTEDDKTRLIQSLKRLSTGNKPKSVLDVEAVIRYFAVHSFVNNEEGYTGPKVGNYSLYEKDGKLTMLPGDYNLAFGGGSDGDAFSVINAPVALSASGSYEDRPMLAWISETKKYAWLYQRYHMEVLNVDLEPVIDLTKSMIAPYVLRDPTKFCTYEEFEVAVDTLKQYLELRTESIQRQLMGKPADVDVGDLKLSAMGGIRTTHPSKANSKK